MKRALISVTNKDGVVDFAKGLVELGFEIVSTGGTMKVLQENGVSCIAIDDVTGFPEMLDGRVKTLGSRRGRFRSGEYRSGRSARPSGAWKRAGSKDRRRPS